MNLFLFHSGRVGSTFLASLLKQISGVCWNGEIFSKNVFVYKGFNELDISRKQGDGVFSLYEFIEYINKAKSGKASNFCDEISCYGCEIKTYHFEKNFFKFNFEDCLNELQNEFENCKFVFIYRKETLRRLVSAQVARENKIYHLTGEQKADLTKIILDTNDYYDSDLNIKGALSGVIMEAKKKERGYMSTIEKHGGVILEYEEDLNNDYMAGVRKITHDWPPNLLPEKFKVSLNKTNPFKLEDIIINYKEVLNSF